MSVAGVGEASVRERIVDLTSDRDDNEADTGADIGTASTDKGSATPGSPSDVLVASGSKTSAPSSAPVYRGLQPWAQPHASAGKKRPILPSSPSRASQPSQGSSAGKAKAAAARSGPSGAAKRPASAERFAIELSSDEEEGGGEKEWGKGGASSMEVDGKEEEARAVDTRKVPAATATEASSSSSAVSNGKMPAVDLSSAAAKWAEAMQAADLGGGSGGKKKPAVLPLPGSAGKRPMPAASSKDPDKPKKKKKKRKLAPGQQASGGAGGAGPMGQAKAGGGLAKSAGGQGGKEEGGVELDPELARIFDTAKREAAAYVKKKKEAMLKVAASPGSELGRMRDEVQRLEGVVSQKEEELKDAEQYQVKLGTECFSLLDEVNESKRILIKLTKDVPGLKELLPVYEYGYMTEDEVAAALKRGGKRKSASEVGDIFEKVDGEFVRNAQFDPFIRRAGVVTGVDTNSEAYKEVVSKYGAAMWELVMEKKQELERCPSGSYPVEVLGRKNQDTKLSEAMQIMSVYVTHLSEHKQAMDAEVKRLRTRINTLEKRVQGQNDSAASSLKTSNRSLRSGNASPLPPELRVQLHDWLNDNGYREVKIRKEEVSEHMLEVDKLIRDLAPPDLLGEEQRLQDRKDLSEFVLSTQQMMKTNCSSASHAQRKGWEILHAFVNKTAPPRD